MDQDIRAKAERAADKYISAQGMKSLANSVSATPSSLAPREGSPISEGLDSTDHFIDELASAVSRLEGRLSSILLDGAPIEGPSILRQGESKVANHISDYNQYIINMTARLQALADRIEL